MTVIMCFSCWIFCYFISGFTLMKTVRACRIHQWLNQTAVDIKLTNLLWCIHDSQIALSLAQTLHVSHYFKPSLTYFHGFLYLFPWSQLLYLNCVLIIFVCMVISYSITRYRVTIYYRIVINHLLLIQQLFDAGKTSKSIAAATFKIKSTIATEI